MNTATIASFLTVTLTCLATSSLPAQQLELMAAVVPGSAEVRVEAAVPGHLVVLLGGLHEADAELPGGFALGIEEPVVLGSAVADADGHAFFATSFPVGSNQGMTFVLQALAIDLGIRELVANASPVARVTVPMDGEIADVYVLFGQSNAEGHAYNADLPANLRGPLPRCRVWNAASQAFEPLTAGVNNRTFSPLEWCGPELGLMRSLSENGRVVHLVKFALSGTALGPTPGAYNEWNVESGELYALLQARIAEACAGVRAMGLTPRVRGICMMQGESDAMDEQWAAGYRERLETLVSSLREHLHSTDATETTAVPFVIGRINTRLPSSFFPFVGTVRTAQQQVVDNQPCCATIESSGLPVMPDQAHFTAAGVSELGRRFATALLALGS